MGAGIRENNPGRGNCLYEDLSREQLERARRKPEIDEIVSVTYQRGIPMVPLVFNFFDKSNDVAGILSVLLVKLGTHYGLSDIVISGRSLNIIRYIRNINGIPTRKAG